MTPLHSGAATLPKGFRLGDGPTTPEPFNGGEEPQAPSAPRPRLRIKRKGLSNLRAPTQQFLASVAAADIPIPSIEEPEAEPTDSNMFDSVSDRPVAAERDTMHLFPSLPGRIFSPPKTPAPADPIPSLSPKRYPDWSIGSSSSLESTPEWESSRPSTSRSTHTSASLFSRFSVVSDDAQCVSPELEGSEQLGPAAATREEDDIVSASIDSKGRIRKAPWTKAMSAHLWSTYLMYLQDPRVTPVRMGKGALPPQGVLSRVARQAKRSWKGSKAASGKTKATDEKSGSSTPTAESSKTYIQWPHTAAATRAHLRDLCRLKAASSGVGNHRVMSSSPTPYSSKASRHWNRRSTPARSPSVFSAGDMAMSLALSTSETMQPNAPIAQITSGMAPIPQEAPAPVSQPVEEPPAASSTLDVPSNPSSQGLDLSSMDRPRLGSPFVARSYGPSSSNSLAATLAQLSGAGLGGIGDGRQTITLGPSRRNQLQPAARLTRSATQKRRTRQSNDEPRKRRPTLAADMFTAPTANERIFVGRERGQTVTGTETRPSFGIGGLLGSRHDDIFAPRLTATTTTGSESDVFMANPSSQQQQQQQQSPRRPLVLSTSTSMPTLGSPVSGSVDSDLPSHPLPPPQRLGSPFSVSSSSYSVPNRFSQPPMGGNFSLNLSAIRRPFATIQQHRLGDPNAAATSTDAAAVFEGFQPAVRAPRASLQTRLAYIDQRLREFRTRDAQRRRSESPM